MQGYCRTKQRKCDGKGVQKSEPPIVPKKSGNQPKGPGGGKGRPSHGAVGGNDAGDTELREHLPGTSTDSGTGEKESALGVYNTGPPHRPGLAAGGVSPNSKGRGGGCRRSDGAEVWGEPGRQPEVAPCPYAHGEVLCPSGAQSLHTQTRREQASYRDTEL
jgi:hypothetical protein